jgi:hypothetical protein
MFQFAGLHLMAKNALDERKAIPDSRQGEMLRSGRGCCKDATQKVTLIQILGRCIRIRFIWHTTCRVVGMRKYSNISGKKSLKKEAEDSEHW